MGASIKAGGGRASGARRTRSKRHAPMAEINVTPFVDVMLVLLIIFMVAAPLLLSGIPVDLPQAKGQALNADKDRLTVTVDRQGRVFVADSEQPISVGELVPKLKAIAKNGVDDKVLFRGDKQVQYGKVSEVLGAVREGGFKNFTFVNGPEEIDGPSPVPAKKR